MSASKIETWHKAGLIDADTRERLLAYEAQNSRPVALWAVFGVGALAIGLGLISVVAANWEEVPGQVRLAIHLVLLAAALAAIVFKERELVAASPWALEALCAISAALGLTFFGHLGQVYQTSSPLWVPIAMWLALFGPALMFIGRSWLTASVLVGGVILCAWQYVFAEGVAGFESDLSHNMQMWLAAVTCAPVLFAPLAAFVRSRSTRADFWRRLEQLALTYAVLGASSVAALASVDAFGEDNADTLNAVSMMVRAVIGLVAGGLVAIFRTTTSGRMSGAIMAASGVTLTLAFLVSGVDLAAALLFMGLWLGIAVAALQAQWRGVFQLAVAAIALRLIILSFELASDLLLSGFGLIIAGLMILGIAWAAFRVTRAFAPEHEAEVAA